MEKKERKFCICLTARQVFGSILLAVSAVNLIVVGAAFETAFPDAVPTNTPTLMFLSPTATAMSPSTATETPADTLTPTWTATSTSTPTATPTDTATATLAATFVPSPVPMQCIHRYDWPVYRIQRGDTLFSLALTTGSSVQELMLANCLVDSRIFAGQLLYVPRLPILPTTAAPLVMPSDTPGLSSNSPSVIKPYGMDCRGEINVFLSAAMYDADGIESADVQLYTDQDKLITTIELTPGGEIYSGRGSLPKPYTVNHVGYYIFSAVDKRQDVTKSPRYNDRSASCVPLPTSTPAVFQTTYPG